MTGIGGLSEKIDGPGKWNKLHPNQGPNLFVSSANQPKRTHMAINHQTRGFL